MQNPRAFIQNESKKSKYDKISSAHKQMHFIIFLRQILIEHYFTMNNYFPIIIISSMKY